MRLPGLDRAWKMSLLVVLACVSAAGVTFLAAVSSAKAGTVTLTSCTAFGDNGGDAADNGPVWTGQSTQAFSAADDCGQQDRGFQLLPTRFPERTGNAQWRTVTPPAIEIVHAVTPVDDVLMDPATSGDGFVDSFFWAGGSQMIQQEKNCCGGNLAYGSGINRSFGPSRYFGWQATCEHASCGFPAEVLAVKGIELIGVDNTPPNVQALGYGNVWYEGNRWIRGSGWPASFQASADDGICSMRAIIAGASVQGPFDWLRNQHSWTQCPTPQTQDLTLDTTQYPNGSLPITLSAADAASPSNVSSPSETLHVDNVPVTLSLTGPSDVPSTAGVQHVFASASAGPSGVADIFCSLDHGAYAGYLGANAQIPVSGLGSHTVSCFAQNSAIDPSFHVATSPLETFQMSIRQPTASAISFSRIADALRCRLTTVGVRVPGRAHIVKRHGHTVIVPGRPRLVKRRETVCHARTVKQKYTVTVMRHGKPVKVTRTRRVALLPHTVQKSQLRIAYGRATTVSGYLGVTSGVALAGRPVEVLSAPDNLLDQFTPMASVVTGSGGTWTATVPPGPSRLIEAVYAGDSTTEPSTTASVKLLVPARLTFSVSPRVLPWRGTIHLRGHLVGGYIPPDGVALRFLVRYPGSRRPSSLLALRTDSRGDYSFTWSYKAGRRVATYPFSVATTATESDYPFAAASSRSITVTFGKPTPRTGHHRSSRSHPHHKGHRRKR